MGRKTSTGVEGQTAPVGGSRLERGVTLFYVSVILEDNTTQPEVENIHQTVEPVHWYQRLCGGCSECMDQWVVSLIEHHGLRL